MARNLSPTEREELFGALDIRGTTGRDTLILGREPPLVSVVWPFGAVRVHELAAPSLAAIRDDLDAAGLLGEVTEMVGFQPRFTRTAAGGNTPNPSAHAYGAAVDVNFSRLPQGEHTDERQSVIAPFFERRGWFWGERFSEPDPHHFAFQGHDPLDRDAPSPAPQPLPAPTVPRSGPGSGLVALGLLLGGLWLMAR